MVTVTSVLNNPPICYMPYTNNTCGPPTTGFGTTPNTIITAANASTLASVPPGPGAYSQQFMGQNYIPGPWLGCTTAVQALHDVPDGGAPAGGCIFPTPLPATNNYVASINNQNNGGFNWSCDGALAMIDPVYVYKGAKQPNILTGYPMYHTTSDPPSAGVVPANGSKWPSANRMTVFGIRTTRTPMFWPLARISRPE
jgi:hypothetical protein